jgi:hypothetical protein
MAEPDIAERLGPVAGYLTAYGMDDYAVRVVAAAAEIDRLRREARGWKEAALVGQENQRRISAALDRLEARLLPSGEPPT